MVLTAAAAALLCSWFTGGSRRTPSRSTSGTEVGACLAGTQPHCCCLGPAAAVRPSCSPHTPRPTLRPAPPCARLGGPHLAAATVPCCTGATILYHDVAFLPDHPEHMRKRRAQYYRLDAPRLAQQLLAAEAQRPNTSFHNISTTTLFYTDTDVLIQRDISSCRWCRGGGQAGEGEEQRDGAKG